MQSRYALDKTNGKFLGVCSGIAKTSGIDPLVVRLGVVVATLFLLGPVAILLYLLTALIADNG